MTNAVLDPTNPTSPLSISPHETALLLIDYQNILRGRIGDAAWHSVTNIALQLRNWALFEKTMFVCHCLVDISPGTMPPRHNKISTKWKAFEEAFAADPSLGYEADALSARASFESTFVRAPGEMSALESDRLMDILRARGIKSLLLGGITTSSSVLSTARAATDRGFVVTVVEDACYDSVPGLHGMVVSHILPVTAHVATSWEIRDAWKIL